MRYGCLLLLLVCGNCGAQQWSLGFKTLYAPKYKTSMSLGYVEFYHSILEKKQFELGAYGNIGRSLNVNPYAFAETGLRLKILEPISGIPGNLQISGGFTQWCEKMNIADLAIKKTFYNSLAFTTTANFRISYEIPITRNISVGPYFQLWGKISGNGMLGNSVCCAPIVGLNVTISLHRKKVQKPFQPLANWTYENLNTPRMLPIPKPTENPVATEFPAFWRP